MNELVFIITPAKFTLILLIFSISDSVYLFWSIVFTSSFVIEVQAAFPDSNLNAEISIIYLDIKEPASSTLTTIEDFTYEQIRNALYNYFFNNGPEPKIRIPMNASSGQITVCSLVSYCSTQNKLLPGYTLSILFEGNSVGDRVLYYISTSQNIGVRLQKK